MRRKWLAVGIILLFVGTCVNSSTAENIEEQSSQGNWLYVGGSGPGNYTKIQDAIDDASDGDTIYVFHGVYTENLHIVNQISLLGENQVNTTIKGQNLTYVVLIESDWVAISNFTIQSGNENEIGIRIFYSAHVTVFQNIILRTCCAINNPIISQGVIVKTDFH